MKKRKQILLNPLYPIIDNVLFNGFPKETEGKLVFFSGGALYKIYGQKGQFMDMMKHILEVVPNSIILYAGTGNEKILKHYMLFFMNY